MVKVYLGLGSNLGDRKGNIGSALKLLAENCDVINISSLRETEPIGYKEQDKFLNGAVLVETSLGARELLLFLKSIEKKLGRVETFKNGPRTIDLDILLYGDLVVNETDLIIPHPKMHEREFILKPMNEIGSEIVHPVLGKSISELLSDLMGN